MEEQSSLHLVEEPPFLQRLHIIEGEHLSSLPLFEGDGTDVGPPAVWLAKILLSLPDSWTEARKLTRFQLQLYPGSLAQEWFESLSKEEKTDMEKLREAFLKRWPMERRPKPSRVQVKQRLKNLVSSLEERDIAAWDEEEKEYKHVIWAEKIVALALELGDSEGTLIHCALEHIPWPLTIYLEQDYKTWEEFEAAVRKLSVALLKDTLERKEREKMLEQAMASLQQQVAELRQQVADSKAHRK